MSVRVGHAPIFADAHQCASTASISTDQNSHFRSSDENQPQLPSQLLLCGDVESNPGPEQSRTNRETSSWLRDNIAQNHTIRENLEKARLFFGRFSGDHKRFVSWKEDLLRKQKSMRKEAQERLMKDVGGTGKYYASPPNDYCPPLEKFRFILEDYQCEKCK